MYLAEASRRQGSQYLLRRNIHRIEKGLLMRPRKEVFAEGYIVETVQRYQVALQNAGLSAPEELQWAHDVLQTYFSVVQSNPQLDHARRIFESCAQIELCDPPRVPYKREVSEPPVSYEAMLQLARRRRSVRWYLQKPVPHELIDKAIEIAALSPGACNRQAFEFRVFDDPKTVQAIASLPGGTKGISQNFPAIAVVVGKLRAYENESDRHLIYIDGSMAAMSFMFALETLGLSSVGINWADVKSREAKMANALRLESDERVILLIAFGYPDPDGLIAYSQKKDLSLLRKYN